MIFDHRPQAIKLTEEFLPARLKHLATGFMDMHPIDGGLRIQLLPAIFLRRVGGLLRSTFLQALDKRPPSILVLMLDQVPKDLSGFNRMAGQDCQQYQGALMLSTFSVAYKGSAFSISH